MPYTLYDPGPFLVRFGDHFWCLWVPPGAQKGALGSQKAPKTTPKGSQGSQKAPKTTQNDASELENTV